MGEEIGGSAGGVFTLDLKVGDGDLYSTRSSSFVRGLLIGAHRVALACRKKGMPWMDRLLCPRAVAWALECQFTFSPVSPKVQMGHPGMVGHAAGFDVYMDHSIPDGEVRLGVSPEVARQVRVSAVLEGTAPDTEVTIRFTTDYELV